MNKSHTSEAFPKVHLEPFLYKITHPQLRIGVVKVGVFYTYKHVNNVIMVDINWISPVKNNNYYLPNRTVHINRKKKKT